MKKARENATTVEFPDCIQEFADEFPQLQEHRHQADNDPNIQFQKAHAETSYELAGVSITSFNSDGNVEKSLFGLGADFVFGYKKARMANARH